ncbi:MAG: AarF/ABC1/UbiB kinase family protein [Pseudanabaenaceae cyanobacterium SKYGB_i_bin29]|nr:AarF/ABC1/UbiB kinase family protein [Pseudanabaenaceae cyanobacterium SKYG29]MDW8421771.1 AarF/ABC1/UbiB kinase family protein [Pseudanabaenaceae cyanobacterium SKYGB_i_bin29]
MKITELLRYDAEVIAQYYRSRWLQVGSRYLAIFVPIFGFIFKLWCLSKLGRDIKNDKELAVELRELLTKLGPAFIKIGQALSTRPDIVPPVYLEELAQLQDRLPSFPNEIAFQFIREELGADPHTIYAEISDQPIAAASLGQVYKGRLQTGEAVAIKVQRPGIVEQIALDVFILRGLAVWMMRTFWFIRSDLRAILDEFASRIFEEMDYTCEAANAEKFAEYYGDLPGIYVPKIYWQYTAKRVLTMEWIEGTKLTEIQRLQEQGFDGRKIIEVGVQCSLRQLLDQGFFHADPHPGNLLVMADGRLAYLDFGMMSHVSREQRYGLIEAIVHLVNRDYEALSRDYVRLGFLKPETNLEKITPALEQVFTTSLRGSVTELDFKGLTDQLSAIMYDYPFRVPAYYALIIRSLVTLEGIALGVDPNFKVMSVAYPYVANRLLTEPTPELHHALRDVLIKDGSFRWHRLHNLLKNAQANQDYNFERAVNHIADFLFSEEGFYLREKLVEELANSLDHLLRQNGQTPAKLWELWDIIRSENLLPTQQLIPIAGQILSRPEFYQLGGQVVAQVSQRAIARWIQEWVLQEEENSPKLTGTPSLYRTVNGKTW